MPKSSTNVEPKGNKNNLKRKSGGSINEHVEGNVEAVDGANGAKTDLQNLAALWEQGFAQMSQDKSKTIAESFKAFKSEFELQYEDTAFAEDEQEANSPAIDDDHEVTAQPPAKKKRDANTTSIEDAVTKLTDSTGAQKTPSNEGKI